MSIFDTIQLRLEDAKNTHKAGVSLASTIYHANTDIFLLGDLGAGKTTFMQGLGEALGIQSYLNSPTYALEQRYLTVGYGELIHIDLYRLSNTQAEELLSSTHDHPSIRCIEWANRLKVLPDRPRIIVELQEVEKVRVNDGNAGRMLRVTFEDETLPSDSLIAQWRRDVRLPEHIKRHCDAVGKCAAELADYVLDRSIIIRKNTLIKAGMLHDLLRFIDFKPNAAPGEHDPSNEDKKTWNKIAKTYDGMKHEEACATFLRERGFPIAANIIEVHGLHLPPPDRIHAEQKLLYYADKRMNIDRLVSLDERFADFRKRYGDGQATKEGTLWLKEAQKIEKELFQDNIPF